MLLLDLSAVPRLVSAPCSISDNPCYVNKSGDNRAPERKDSFDHATLERTLEAVSCKTCSAWFSLLTRPQRVNRHRQEALRL